QHIHAFEHQRAPALLVERNNHVPAEIRHRRAKFTASLHRQQIAMKALSSQRARDRPIRTDQPKIESKLLGDGQGKRMAASSNQRDFHPMLIRLPQRLQIKVRDVKLRVKQGAININGKKTNGKSHWKNSS